QGERVTELADSSPQCDTLAGVLRLTKGSNPWVSRGNLAQDLPAAIHGPIIDGEHLTDLRPVQYMAEDGRKGPLLVVDRHHHAQQAVGARRHDESRLAGNRARATTPNPPTAHRVARRGGRNGVGGEVNGNGGG